MRTIDLNCDMGEGIGNEAFLLPFISSANIACGYHAGDAEEMKQVVNGCIKNNVAIGAHPSYPDKENFGRTVQHLSTNEIYLLVKKQLEILNTIVVTAGATLHHVKPHGALYNMAAKDGVIAQAIAMAVKDFDNKLIYYGLSGSVMIDEAKNIGLQTAQEVFADRTYQPDGSLTARTEPNALITETEIATQQVLQMVNNKTITTTNGSIIPIHADTICIHGDGIHAVSFAAALNNSLRQAGINKKKINY